MRQKNWSLGLPGEGSWRLGLLLLAVATYFGFGIAYHNFLSLSNFEVILLNVSATLIAGVGTMMLLVSGNVDLSIGSLWAFDAMIVALVAHDTQGVVVPVAVGLVLGLATGLVNGTLVRYLRINPLIVTLAMNLIWGGAAYIVSGGYALYGFSASFDTLGNGHLATVPVPVVVGGAIFLLGVAYLWGTVGGLRIYAIGGNPRTARLAGVGVDRTTIGLYAVNGLLIGVVAILNVAQTENASPQTGATFALEVLTAVILGGVGFAGGSGNPFGVFIGIVTVGIIVAGLIFVGIASWYQNMAQGAILLVALATDQVLLNRQSRARKPTSGRRTPWWTGALVPSRYDGPEEAEVAQSDPAAQRTTRRAGSDKLLECRNLKRSFGAVVAVADVSFTVGRGEVVALVGDNGAGKSTVVGMLAGGVRPDAGSILLDGQPMPVGDPGAVRRLGIETVYQDLALCRNLSVKHNIVLGAEPARRVAGILRLRRDDLAARTAADQLAQLGLREIDPSTIVRFLSGGQQQGVALARALRGASRLVIMDEPTAALGVRQTAVVLGLIRAVAARGIGVIVVSHDIESVMDVSDSLVVLRRGGVVHYGPTSGVSAGQLVHLMAGLVDEARESLGTGGATEAAARPD
jgi:ribose/xylose/arabinose/galactoside ABC-type transport system permease subunit/ABC-type branched-subunit amino acid transport system ATPase component